MTHTQAIKDIMAEQGLTQSQLAMKISDKGDQRRVSRHLLHDVRLSNLIAMANALGYDVLLSPKPEFTFRQHEAGSFVLDSVERLDKKEG